MKFRLPEITLSRNSRVWIEAVYEAENNGVEYSYAKIRSKTFNQIETPFDVKDINYRLFNGRRVTLLGIAFLDPDSPLFDIADKVIKAIKQMLLSGDSKTEISAKDISILVNESEYDVGRVFNYLGDIGSFWDSASGTGDILSLISIRNEKNIEAYLSYSSIEDLLERTYRPRSCSDEMDMFEDPTEPLALHSVSAKNTAFVIMAIDPGNKMLEDSMDTIKRVFLDYGIDAVRVDEIQHSGVITELILKKIRESEYLICDLTGERPNVYYEIGYAHACNKQPIIVRQKGTRLHFDLQVHNAPEYENMKELRKILTDRLKAAKGKQ